MKTKTSLTGINLFKEISEVTTLAECPLCGDRFILEDIKKFNSSDKISAWFILCPNCSAELHFFFWFDW
jgi:predicted RNA-binding Zn-ribbon protein involved in translation (DUF1610 family)